MPLSYCVYYVQSGFGVILKGVAVNGKNSQKRKGEFCFDYGSPKRKKKIFIVSEASGKKLGSKKWDKNIE